MRLSSQNIRLRSLRHYDTNTWIYNFISVPQITQFLLKGAIISCKINPCSSSTKQKTCKGWNNKTMTAIFSFISTLYLKQQTNILRRFCSLKFENSLFSKAFHLSGNCRFLICIAPWTTTTSDWTHPLNIIKEEPYKTFNVFNKES